MSRESGLPKESTCTEWSITNSEGINGLMLATDPPSLTTASRIAAKSTMQGTPVKSCSTTRAGMKAISVAGSSVAFHWATASIEALVTDAPSSQRSRFSSRIFIENGNLDRSKRWPSFARLKMV